MKNFKKDLVISAAAGISLLLSAALLLRPIGEILVRIFPSENEDDVRIDLILPLYLICYLIGLAVSYAAVKYLMRYPHYKKLNATQNHIGFSIIAPFFLVGGFILSSAVFLATDISGDFLIISILTLFLGLASTAAYFISLKINTVDKHGN